MPSATCCLRIWARHLGVELVVDVVAAGLVLDERERVRELADVVVVRRDAGEQRIGADRLGRALREVADHQRVVVRAGRLDEEPAQQRLRRVRQLEQLEHREDPEHVAEHRERARPPRPPSPPPDSSDAAHSCERRRVEVALAEQRRTIDDDRDVDDATASPAWTKTWSRSPRRIADDAGQAAEEHVVRELERRRRSRRPPIERDHRDDDRRDARVEQDREEHADGRGRAGRTAGRPGPP